MNCREHFSAKAAKHAKSAKMDNERFGEWC
jgi:hypothetical protein